VIAVLLELIEGMHQIVLAMMDIIIILHLSKPVKNAIIQLVQPAKQMILHVLKHVIVIVLDVILQECVSVVLLVNL
jgi:hypothetical protein